MLSLAMAAPPTAPAAMRSASMASSAILARVTASSWMLSVSIASLAITRLSRVAPAIFWLVICTFPMSAVCITLPPVRGKVLYPGVHRRSIQASVRHIA